MYFEQFIEAAAQWEEGNRRYLDGTPEHLSYIWNIEALEPITQW